MGEAIISRGGQGVDVVNNLLSTVAGSALDSTQGKILNDKITTLNTKLETINYVCTGTADSTAIATIVNNFFNSGTAMTMKLTVTGTMGIAFTSTYYAMQINATNTRGAVCYLDFSNCYIPDITTSSRDFLNIVSSTIKIVVYGLVIKTTGSGIRIANSNNCSFHNCVTTSTGSSGVHIAGGNNNSFNNCIISGLNGVGIIGVAGTTNSFNNCTINGNTDYGASFAGNNSVIFTACKIIGAQYGFWTQGLSTSASLKFIGCYIKGSGSTYDIYQDSTTAAAKWYIMGNSFAYSSIRVNNATQSASTSTANANLYMPAYANLFSQTIT